MKKLRENTYIEADIKGGTQKFKVNRSGKDVYFYSWNDKEGKWEIIMSLSGEFSVTMEDDNVELTGDEG